jgi:L-ascorbate metabolism protein UlaG (beta-lactamase superfamily)
MWLEVFGKNPGKNDLVKLKQSPNYRNGFFQNVEPTEIMLKGTSFLKMTKDFFNKPASVSPAGVMPSVKSDLKNIHSSKPVITWFGHSSYLISSKGFHILVDPVFKGSASPFPGMVKSFRGTDIYDVDSLPPVDLLLITHDHFDHLNYGTVSGLRGKVSKVIVPAGVASHLRYWGWDEQIITEMDWWDSTRPAADIKLTATPARHFSGRTFTRNKTLWVSYVLSIHGFNLFAGGDSGYDKQFEVIGKKFGPFDLAILECGQYGKNWPYIHMLPEETVQAAKDLGAKIFMPVHWGKFALSFHAWNEPAQRVYAEANKKKTRVAIPKIGEPLILDEPFVQETWWNDQL